MLSLAIRFYSTSITPHLHSHHLSFHQQIVKLETVAHLNNIHMKHIAKGSPYKIFHCFVSKFKVQEGQIGNHRSDISYSSICRQINETIKEKFSEAKILKGVLRVIKAGSFKDMLMYKEELIIEEVKGFCILI